MDAAMEVRLFEACGDRDRYLDALLDLRPLIKYGSVNDWRRMEQILDAALASYLARVSS